MDRYRTNPFRLLDLPHDATQTEIRRRGKLLLQSIELGQAVTAASPLPFLPTLALDRERVQYALRELEDPARRIRHEVFHLWRPAACMPELLQSGKYLTFVEACQTAASQGGAGLGPALHELAIVRHAAAIEAARDAVAAVPAALSDWTSALEAWQRILQNDEFWQYIQSRIHAISDPRLKPDECDVLREELPAHLLDANLTLAAAADHEGDLHECFHQLITISAAPFPEPLRLTAGERIARPILDVFRARATAIETKLRDDALQPFADAPDGDASGKEKLKRYLRGIERDIEQTIVPLADQARTAYSLLELRDLGAVLNGTAEILRSLSVTLNNDADDPDDALRVLYRARPYTLGRAWIERWEADERMLRYLAAQQSASTLVAASRYKEALAKLTEALDLAPTSEDRQKIETWQASVRQLQPFDGLQKIDHAPSLRQTNGIGTALFGERQVDKESGSYLATLFFTIFYFPVVPIAVYRVINMGDGRFRFLGKAPLGKITRLYRYALAALAIMGFIFLIVSSTPPDTNGTTAASTPAQESSQTTTDSQATSSQIGSLDVEQSYKARLGRWIDQERAAIEQERNAILQDQSALDEERLILRRQKDDLDSRADDLNDSNQSEIDSYNEQVDHFNQGLRSLKGRERNLRERERAFDARIQQFNEKVREYNDQP